MVPVPLTRPTAKTATAKYPPFCAIAAIHGGVYWAAHIDRCVELAHRNKRC